MAEEYYSYSPYNYVLNNPIKYIDPDGKSPYYDPSGNYLGVDRRGFIGGIIISTRENYLYAVSKDISLKDNKFIENTNLSAKAYSKIYTHILRKSSYDTEMLIGGSIAVRKDNQQFNDPSRKEGLDISTITYKNDDKFKISVNQSANLVPEVLSTVENVQSALGKHEFEGHGKKGYSTDLENHHKAYELQIEDKTWKKTTPLFQDIMWRTYRRLLSEEVK